MKVNIEIRPELAEPYAVIYTPRVDQRIARLADSLDSASNRPFLLVEQGEETLVLRPDELFMARFEQGRVALYTRDKRYDARLPLYQVAEQLGAQFLRISKTTLVDPQKIERIQPSFGGTMVLCLQNGLKDTISRKYWPAFKHAIGL